jgi:hydrogenase/urease accessory protein HupE
MRRLVAPLALLILLAMGGTASAHVTKPGFSEVRQHGTHVNYVLGLETEPLVAVAGESKAEMEAYLTGAVRMTVDGESCTSSMRSAEPLPHRETPYTRVWLDMECPQAQGAFRVDYDLPMENVVDYELGGAKGTYLFDPDHRSMSADSPGFTRFVEEGVEHIVLGWDHVLFLVILLLGASSFKQVVKLATAFTAAHSVTLALAVLGVVDVPSAIVEPLIAASIVYVAVENVLGDGESKKRLAVVFAFGLLHGLGFAGAMTFPDGTPILSALIAFNVGIELGQAMIIAVVFPLLLAIRRFDWAPFAHAAAGSAAAAMGLFWLSQRVLGG